MNATVYNIETGEKRTIPGIDAKEYVESGGWVYGEPEKSEPKASKPVDEKELEIEVKAKTRKRKS